MSAADDLAERLTAALADAIRLVDGHTRLIDERAAQIAEETVRDVRAAAEVRVADAEHLARVADQLREAAEILVVARERDLDRVVRERDTAEAERDAARLDLARPPSTRPAVIRVITWDWRASPADTAMTARAVMAVSAGRLYAAEVDTGCDEHVLVIADREVTDEEAMAVLERGSS